MSNSKLVQYAVLNDIHFPYEGQCYYKALDLMRSWPNLRGIYLNGDVAEIESVSAHPKSPRAQQSLLDELEYVNKKFDQIEAMFPGVPVHYVCGNHEFRMYRFLRDVAPQLWGMLECPKLFRFDERPMFRFYDYGPKQLVKVGETKNLFVRHEPLGGGANHAKGTAEKSVVSLIYGHTHTYQKYTHKKFGPEPFVVTATSNGFLADINADCMNYRGPRDNWQEGFTRVECLEKTGEHEDQFIYL